MTATFMTSHTFMAVSILLIGIGIGSWIGYRRGWDDAMGEPE